jgi:hypothetical protein
MALNVRLVRLCNAAPAGRGLCVKPLGVRGIASAASGIPVVDFGAFRQSADAASRRKAAAAVLDACVNVGFVYLKNHGVSPASVRGIFGQVRRSLMQGCSLSSFFFFFFFFLFFCGRP